MLKKLFDKILEILYPNVCCFCGTVGSTSICCKCKKKVIYIKEPRCKKCGRPVRYAEQEICYECQKKEFFYEQGKSIWLHKDPVNSSIYQFKYHNKRVYGKFYAEELFHLFWRDIKMWEIEVIIPIPLHKKRKKVRGFNQAEIIAKELGRLLNLPVDTRILKRIRYTDPQKKLDGRERKQNLQNAFKADFYSEKYKKVLLIDDIYTTGSTINEAAKVLKKEGVSNVWFLTISIGQDF